MLNGAFQLIIIGIAYVGMQSYNANACEICDDTPTRPRGISKIMGRRAFVWYRFGARQAFPVIGVVYVVVIMFL